MADTPLYSSREASRLEAARLDRELREIVIEERCSFGAELRAELVAAHERLQLTGGARNFSVRRGGLAVAAAVVLLLVGSLAVPPARASLVWLFGAAPEPVTMTVEAVPKPRAKVAVAEEVSPGPIGALESPPPLAWPRLTDIPIRPVPLPATLPALLDRNRARQIVAEEYPAVLQHKGIGGTVGVLLWVRPDGASDYPQVGHSSGVPELDMAALRATRSLRFLPATRSGQAVGTWVEFSIRFVPNAPEAQPAPEYQAFQIPLSN